MHNHLNSSSLAQTAPAVITPLDTLSPDPSDPPRPVTSQLLEGTRERLYWENLPEATRRAARKAAAGPAAIASVGVPKKRKRPEGEVGENSKVVDEKEIKKRLIEEIIVPAKEAAAAQEEAPVEKPKRKKASKF